jgi:hypothetical protein
LKRPPCVGASAYTDEEHNWCAATLHYYVDGMDAARRAARGIPESAVTRRRSGCPTAGGASCGDGRVEASPAGGASGGAGRVGASASGEGNDSAEEEDEVCSSTQIISRKRGRGQCRQETNTCPQNFDFKHFKKKRFLPVVDAMRVSLHISVHLPAACP